MKCPKHNRLISVLFCALALLVILGGNARAANWTPLFRNLEADWTITFQHWRYQRTPFFIDKGRVYFVQADLTLTVLDLQSGEVIQRDTTLTGSRTQGYADYGIFRHVSDEAAVSILGWSSIVVINRRTGNAKMVAVPEHTSYAQAYAGRVYYIQSVELEGKGWDEVLVALDLESFKEVIVGNGIAGRSFYIMEDRLYIHSDVGREEPSRIECYELETRKLLWQYEVQKREQGRGYFLRPIMKDGLVYLLFTANDPKSEYHNGKRKYKVYQLANIVTLDRYGKAISVEQARREDFGGWPSNEERTLTFRGTEFSGIRPFDVPAPGMGWRQDKKEIEIVLDRKPGNPFQKHDDEIAALTPRELLAAVGWKADGSAILLDKRGIAGVTFVREPQTGDAFGQNGKGMGIYCIENGRMWRGRITGMDTPELLPGGIYLREKITLSATEDLLVIGTPNGRVECLDRKTGRSQWIYSYPVFDFWRWQSDALARYGIFFDDLPQMTFYTQERQRYVDGLSPAAATAVTVDGIIPDVPVTVDPSPHPFPSASILPYFIWLFPLLLLSLLALAIWFNPITNRTRAVRTLYGEILLGLTFFIILSRYDFFIASLLVWLVVADIVARLIFVFLPKRQG